MREDIEAKQWRNVELKMPGEDGPREGAGHSKTQEARRLDFCFRVLNANRYDEIQLVSSIPRTPKRSSMRFFRGEVLGGKLYGKLTICTYFQDMCIKNGFRK